MKILYQKYLAPEIEVTEYDVDGFICVKGSGSNEDYNVNNFNWN